ncbi:MAG: lipid II flippase MurJ [bacterium]|nr:lipid II flippase MurJ [bacterium]
MVHKVLSVLTREIRGLHEAAYLLALFSLLSQVLALVRDRTFAHLFGAGPTLDAYFGAFKIPDLVFAFLALFVSSYALVPLLSGKEKKDQGAVVGNVLFTFGIVSILAAGLLWFLLPRIAPYLFPGFSPEVLDNTILLSRIILIQPILLGLSSIATSLLQVMRQFVIYALAPILYNVGIIVGAVFFYPLWGIPGLAWGVVFGAALHLAAQVVPILGHARHLVRPTLATLRSSIIEVAMPSMPRALALSAQQILLLVFTGIASAAAVGTVSAFSFALNLQSVPLTVIGISYAVVVFPALAALVVAGDSEGFVRELWASVRHVIFWTMPAITLVIVLRAHIVRLILGSGEFSWSDTRLTAAILALFAVSLISQSVILIFSRAYYAAQKVRVPIFVNIGAAVVAAFGAYLGVFWIQHAENVRFFMESLFRVADVPGTPVLMIPFAYSVAIIGASFAFAYLFAKEFGFEERTWHTLGTSFAASVIGAGAAYAVLQILGPLLPLTTTVGLLTQAASAGAAGLVVWALTLYLLKSQEFSEMRAVAFGKPANTVP